MSEVRISLKNGRDIIAESCSELNGRIVCEKNGGTFEIDKEDIQHLGNMTLKHEIKDESPVQEPVSEGEGKKEADKSTGVTKDSATPGEGLLVRGANPEQEKRLDEITQRKLQLKQERDKLSKDREELQQDTKNMGMVYTQEQFDGINKRISDVEERIKTFNEEVKKLNEEEEKIIGNIRSKQ